MVVACIGLAIALSGTAYAVTALPRNSVGTAQLKANAVNSAKVKNRSLLRADFKAGQLPAGATGSAGPAGPTGSAGPAGPQGAKGDRGPSFGDGRQIPNMNNIPCGQDVVVGSQTLTVTEPSRIWVHGHGALRDDASAATEYGLWLQLRNAGDTATLAVSTRAWDVPGGDEVLALSPGGLMLPGDDPDSPAPAFVAPAGTYILQLAVLAGGGGYACAGNFPDFGFNQGSAMGYVLLGNG